MTKILIVEAECTNGWMIQDYVLLRNQTDLDNIYAAIEKLNTGDDFECNIFCQQPDVTMIINKKVITKLKFIDCNHSVENMFIQNRMIDRYFAFDFVEWLLKGNS